MVTDELIWMVLAWVGRTAWSEVRSKESVVDSPPFPGEEDCLGFVRSGESCLLWILWRWAHPGSCSQPNTVP